MYNKQRARYTVHVLAVVDPSIHVLNFPVDLKLHVISSNIVRTTETYRFSV
jgi:hypothetical protein